MVARRTFYERVNNAWPAAVPTLCMHEAERAIRRLCRFCKVKPPPQLVETGGNRHTRLYAGYVNCMLGWRSLVHHLSHWIDRRTVGAGHSKSHARLELRLIKQVVRRGWLDGALRPKPKPAVAVPTSTTDSRIEHAQAMLRKAETREKRATTIRRKWERRMRGLQRAAAAKAVAS